MEEGGTCKPSPLDLETEMSLQMPLMLWLSVSLGLVSSGLCAHIIPEVGGYRLEV